MYVLYIFLDNVPILERHILSSCHGNSFCIFQIIIIPELAFLTSLATHKLMSFYYYWEENEEQIVSPDVNSLYIAVSMVTGRAFPTELRN